MITAELAAERSVPVMAVPGSARARAARGDEPPAPRWCAPVIDVADVLTALALDHRLQAPPLPDPRHRLPGWSTSRC